MEKLVVLVDWCEKNYSALINENIDGMVIVTAKTMEELLIQLNESIQLHLSDEESAVCVALKQSGYELEYKYTMSAILQNALNFTTLAALSRITGIKHAQLSHYANAVSRPKQEQYNKIISGLHTIGNACLSIN